VGGCGRGRETAARASAVRLVVSGGAGCHWQLGGRLGGLSDAAGGSHRWASRRGCVSQLQSPGDQRPALFCDLGISPLQFYVSLFSKLNRYCSLTSVDYDAVCSNGSTADSLTQFCCCRGPGEAPQYHFILALSSLCVALHAY
jgi:hypothetical protein